MAELPFSPEQLAHIKAYAEPRYTWHLVQLALDLVYDAVLLAFLVRPMFRLAQHVALKCTPAVRWAEKVPVLRVLVRVPRGLWGESGSGTALVFIGLGMLLATLYDLPGSIYIGYFHEKAFGLSPQSPGRYAWDSLKGLAVETIAYTCLYFGLLGLARRLRYWWLIMAAVVAVAMPLSTALDPLRSKIYIESHPLEPGPLRDAITAVLVKAKVPFGDIRVEQTSAKSVKPDAYFAGQGPTRTVVLYDTLIALLTADELVAAVAHEAGHADESRWKSWVGTGIALFVFLWLVEWMLRLVAKRGWWGVTERADVRSLSLIVVLFSLTTFAVSPVSKWRQRNAELDADQFALNLTHDPAAFKSMLIKISRVALVDPEPPRWHVWLDLSHPPLMERLAAVDAWKTPTAGEP